MTIASTISPFIPILKAFPGQRLKGSYPDELKYVFATPELGAFYEGKANRMILKEGLPLVTELKIWHVGGKLREVALYIKPVPEEHMIDDEVPGEVLEPDWYEFKERE